MTEGQFQAVQTGCCAHDIPSLCDCQQGFKSHAKPHGEPECVCGKIKVAEQAWQNCSGQTHVFQPGASRCGCLKRSADPDNSP